MCHLDCRQQHRQIQLSLSEEMSVLQKKEKKEKLKHSGGMAAWVRGRGRYGGDEVRAEVQEDSLCNVIGDEEEIVACFEQIALFIGAARIWIYAA